MPDIRTIVQQMIDAGKSKEEIEEFVERAKEKMAGKTDDSPVKTETPAVESKAPAVKPNVIGWKAPNDMGSESDDGSLESLNVTRKETRQTEEKAIKTLKARFGGLGFSFEETGATGDYITITSPPDKDGNTKTEEFSFDKFWGNIFGSDKREADKINSFIKDNYQTEDMIGAADINTYANTINHTEKTTVSILDKDGKAKEIEDLTAKELEQHQKQMFLEVMEDDKIWGGVVEDIKPSLEQYTTEQTILMAKKHDLYSQSGVDEANKELEKLVRAKQEELVNNSPEYKKLVDSVSKAVVSKYGHKDMPGSLINEKYVLEAEEEILPFSSALRNIPIIGDAWADLSHGFGVGRTQIAKGDNEYRNIIAEEYALKNEGKEISDLEQMLKDGANENDPYKKMSKPSIREGVSTEEYSGTIGDRIKTLQGKIPERVQTINAGISKSNNYQEKLSKLDPAEIFDESIFNPQVTTDEFQRMLGTQGAQMIGGILMYPTFAQESGGIATESIVIESARKTFPQLYKDVENPTTEEDKKAKEEFQQLGEKARTRIMTKVVSNGEVDFGPAVKYGAAAASLDIVSNFFVFAKATKAVPTSVIRDIKRLAFKKVLTSQGAKGLYAATAVESVTEAFQEALGIGGVSVATGYMEGGKFWSENNVKRMMEGAGQAFLTTPFLTSGGKVAVAAKKEFNAKVFANPKQARALVNKKKKLIDQAMEDGLLTQEERDNEFSELEAVEDMVNNIDQYKSMDLEQKEATINRLVQRKQLEKRKRELEVENDNIKKANTGGVGNVETLQNQKRINDVDTEIAEKNNDILKEVFISNYFQDGKLAEYINTIEEGNFKGKKFKRFENKKEANEYFQKFFKSERWLNVSQDITSTIKRFTEKGLSLEDAKMNAFIEHAKHGDAVKLQKMLDMRRLWDGDVNAAVEGNTAWTIDENVIANIRKGDLLSTNAVHHEGLHFIQDNMSIEQLQEMKLAIEKELISTTDPKLLKLAILAQKSFEGRYGNLKESDPRYYKEWMTNLSDVMKAINLMDLNEENTGTLFNVGGIFGGMFKRQTQMTGMDWSKFDAGNALQYIQKWNKFQGVSSGITVRMPRGKVNTEQEDKKSDGEMLASEVYKDINDAFLDYADVDREMASNLAADMMQGIVFDRLLSLKNNNLIEGFETKDLEELQLQFTGPTKDLPKNLKNRGAVGLLKGFDLGFKGGVMGYFNAEIRGRKMLDMRLQEFVENHPKYGNIQVSMQEKGVTEAVEAQEAALSPEDIMIQKEEKKREKRKPKKKEDVMLHKELEKRGFKGSKAVHDYLVVEYTKLHKAGKLEGMSLADLKKIGEAKVQELFGVKPKPGNLTKPDVTASQMAVKKLGKDFFVNYVFGKHHTEGVALRDNSGKAVFDKNGDLVIDPETKELSTGLPQVLQSERPTKSNGLKEVRDTFFENINRGKNLKLKRLKKFDDNYFFEKYGVLSDDPNLYKKSSNISQLHRGTHARVLQVMSSQAARQVLPQGRSFDLLADGLSDVMFSEGMVFLDENTFTEVFAALPEVGMRLRPFVNDYEKRHLTAAIKTVLPRLDGKKIKLTNGEEVIASTYITNALDKILSRYSNQVKRFKSIGKTPVDINEYVLNEVLDQEQTLLQMFKPTIDGKEVKTIEQLWQSKEGIQAIRDSVKQLVESLGEKYGEKQAVRIAIAYLSPMFAGASKIADGRFDVDSKGNVFEVKGWARKKEDGTKKDNRKQAFKNIEDFITHGVNGAIVNEKVIQITFKPQTRKGKTFQVIDEIFIGGVKTEVNTGYLAQSSKTFVNKIKGLTKKVGKKKAEIKVKEQSALEAKEAREFIHDIVDFYKAAGHLDNSTTVMMLNSLNSNMKTAMRRAANFKYVSDGYDKVLDPNQDLEYEHMIPANWMMIKHVQGIYDGSVTKKNLAEFYKEYNVAIIPKKMDLVLKESGYNSTMPATYMFGNPSWERYYNNRTLGKNNIVAIRELGTENYIGTLDEKISKGEFNKRKTLNKAIVKSRTTSFSETSKGITVLDFDDTLATTKSNILTTAPDGTEGKMNAEEYASNYEDLAAQGYTFDFSEFNKVVEGKTAPLFQKALKLQGKFGPENMFVLTARPPAAAKAIFEFLKANGLNIPIKNITGLANSTAEAKALWIADKVGEGYNDFYFADDALQNVKAVKNMLDQFDVKSKVQQARVKFSKSMNTDFNDILENVTDIESKKRFSAIKARKRGDSKGKFRFFIPPSHEDFVGLLYNFIGKGKEGNAHRDFFEKALVGPLNRGYREIDTAKQAIANDYKELNKQFPDVKKKLIKNTPDGDFTFQDAIRVYLWNKHGYKIPGLTTTDQQSLVDLVVGDPELQAYAETLNVISKQEKYVDPGQSWEAGNIRIDLIDATGRVGRAEYFAEFNENAEVMFSPENLNKIEAAYGKDFREALEDMLHRIKTGVNRPKGSSSKPNMFMNWLNASVSGVMFFNTRSALLQQLSNVNFLNFADNNIYAAGKAFANQPQYWKDFAMIFNSDMLKQRRGGLGTDINGAELAEAIKKARPDNMFDQVSIIVGKALKLGFLPTQIGDNIAIATGGAAFYRNRVNKYIKDGLSVKNAEAKAFTDLQNITNSTQQSARPDMTSQQQASWIGKLVLNFLNTPSQYNRIIKKAGSDILNRRMTPPNTNQTQSDMSNTSRILYYGAAQNLIFYSLQTALFAVMFGTDDEDDDKRAEQFLKKKERVINGSIDTILRGSGIYGVAVSTLKNMIIKFLEQRDPEKYNKDEAAVLTEALNFSPVVGIKARRIVNAEKTLNYNVGVMNEMETFDAENPTWSAVTNYTQAITGAPVNKIYQKAINLKNAADNQYTALQRVLFLSGYTTWSLNLGDTEKMKDVKQFIKDQKEAERKAKRKKKKKKIIPYYR